MSDVGRKLRIIRKSKKLKLKDVAKAAGIAQSSLSYIENGTNIPTVDTLERILNALGLSLAEFFADNGQAEEVSPEVRRVYEKIKKLSPDKLRVLESVLDTWTENDK